MDDASDRDSILARRAWLISSVFAVLGCQPPTKPPHPTLREPTQAELAREGARSWASLVADAPPRRAPSSVPWEEAKEIADRLIDIERDYATLRRLHASIPDPACLDEACLDTWRTIAANVDRIDKTLPSPGIGGCARASGARRATLALADNHARFLREVFRRIDAHIRDVVRAGGPELQAKWAEFTAPPPHKGGFAAVCLSLCRPPPYPVIDEALLFEPNESAPAKVTQLDDIASSLKQGRDGDRFVVRGHADSTEEDPEALALERAKKTRDALVKRGVDGTKISVAGLGSHVPVDTSRTEEGRAHNRAVWIDTVVDP